jgi:uncharacterized repeat protein (TIGR02543 family)
MREKFLVTLLALFTVFAMLGVVSCGGDDPVTPPYVPPVTVTITKDFNWPADATGGTAPTAVKITILKGGQIGAANITPPTSGQIPEDYTFVGWYTLSSGGTQVTATKTYSANDTIFARWRAVGSEGDLTITFNYNYESAGVYTTVKLFEDDGIGDLPAHPARTDYKFVAWYTTSAVTGDPIDWDTWTAIADQNVYAKWYSTQLTNDVAPGTFVEKFKSGNAAQAIYRFKLPDNAKVSDYEKISVTYKLDEASLNSRIRFSRVYGDFSAVINNLDGMYTSLENPDYANDTVYNFNFGSYNNAAYQANLVYGSGAFVESMGLQADTWFTMDYVMGGNAPGGWAPPNDAIRVLYFGLGISGNRTFDYAADGNYDLDDGITQLIKDVTLVPKSASGVAPVISTGSGFDKPAFAAYQNEPGDAGAGVQGLREVLGGALFDDGTSDPAKYKITFNFGHAGQAAIEAFFFEGQTMGFTLDPQREAFDFLGWYDAATGGALVDFASWTATEAATFYAYWQLDGNEVTFDPNYVGATPIVIGVPTGAAIGEQVPGITRPGYKFAGWYDLAIGGTLVDNVAAVEPTDSTLIYYAYWTSVAPELEITGDPIGQTFSYPGSGAISYTYPADVEGYTTITVELTFTRDEADEAVEGVWRPMKVVINGGSYSDVKEAEGDDPGDPTAYTVATNLAANGQFTLNRNDWPAGSSAPFSVSVDKITFSYPEE